MIDIRTEYRKGVLFIRLIGRIDNNDYLNEIRDLINKIGINYIVLNLENLNYISLESIDHIMKYNNEILKKKKHLLICDSNQGRGRIFEKFIPNISSELEAFSLI
ncbi:MAG: hypothetical protein IJ509_01385 [Bacilli bacterium]|nr:hypothetical protein [Bacilli bacterium]